MRHAAVAAAALLAVGTTAHAQTLTFPSYRDATIRGGGYANTRYGTDPILETRASDDDGYVRRAVLMFATAESLPSSATIGSATLALTVKGGNAQARTLTACAVPVSFREPDVTWRMRDSDSAWRSAGGDIVSGDCSTGTVSATTGSQVVFDVTRQTQKAVQGAYGSRYARFLVSDLGPSSRDSYKQYYSNNASNTALRPRLVVSTGSTSPSSTTGGSGSGSLTLRSYRDATIRGGAYENSNYGRDPILETRASTDDVYVRRAVLMFATAEALPQSTTIASAKLVLTVKGGNAQNRTLTACAVPVSFREPDVTWRMRDSNSRWSHAGGDIVSGDCSTATVSAKAGSQVVFDVTEQTQKAVQGTYGSRYARFLVGDSGASSRDSYKQYYSNDDSHASLRPALVVTTGSASAPADSTSSGSSSGSSSSSTLRVLQWNTHHGGYGTDGKYDPNRIATWIAKFNPDVISLNEIEYYTGWGNEDQPARYAALLKQKTGRTWYYRFATATGAAKGNGNLILSKYPLDIKDRFQLTYDRVVVQVCVHVNGRTVDFFSTHLDADSTSRRLAQIKELTTWSSGIAQQRIIAGDFNAWPGSTENATMKGSYYDSWAEAARKGIAVAYSGNSAGNTRNSRIDYIYYSHGASGLTLKKVQVFDTRDANGVMPSDHRPVMATFSIQ